MSDPTSDIRNLEVASSAPTSSVWSRMMNVFATPGDVFAEVKQSPPCSKNWLFPVLVLIVVGWVFGWIVLSQGSVIQHLKEIQERQIQKMVDQGKMSREQVEAASAFYEKFGPMMTKIATLVAPPVVAFASLLWWGFILWLFAAKVFKAGVTFLKSLEVAGLASMISVVGGVVKSLMMIIFGSLFAGPNLGMFVKEFDPNNPMHGALGAIDITVFWALAVTAIGLAKLAGIGTARATVCVFGSWAVLTATMIGLGFAIRRLTGS